MAQATLIFEKGGLTRPSFLAKEETMHLADLILVVAIVAIAIGSIIYDIHFYAKMYKLDKEIDKELQTWKMATMNEGYLPNSQTSPDSLPDSQTSSNESPKRPIQHQRRTNLMIDIPDISPENPTKIRLFVSQPMTGIEQDEVIKTRTDICLKVQELYDNKYEIELLENYYKFNAPSDATRLWYLTDSLTLLPYADLVAFAPNWIKHKGCIIEKEICYLYDVPVIMLDK